MKKIMRRLEQWPLGRKLSVAFLVLMLFAIGEGLVNLQSQLALVAQIQVLHNQELLGVSNARSAQVQYSVIGRELRQALLAGPGKERELAIQLIGQAQVELEKTVNELRGRIFYRTNKRRLADFEARFGEYRSNVARALDMLQQGQEDACRAFVSSAAFRAPGMAANTALEELADAKEMQAQRGVDSAVAAATDSVKMAIVLLTLGALVTAALAWLIARSIRNPIAGIQEAVQRLADGDLSTQVPCADYANEIGAVARAVQVLQHGASAMDAMSWVKGNLAELSSALQTVDSFTDLSQVLFSRLAPLVHIGHGAFYIFEEQDRRLRLLGGYALRERKELNQYFAMGQGLVGQCAMERAPIILTQPPPDYVRIASSLGEATPVAIVVLPILRNDRLLGVLELATFAPMTERQQSLLDGVMPTLAMNLEILERSVRTNKLLDETRRQAQEMQMQAATLEEQAVELEAQKSTIQDTETWFRGIIESAPDGMLVVHNGVINLVNRRTLEIFGYTEDEMMGQPIEMLVPLDLRSRHVGLRDGFAASGKDGEMARMASALMGRRKDGSEFPIEVGLARLPAVGGRGLSVCAAVRDITERKLIERAMADQKAALQEIMDNSPVGTAFSTGGVFRYTNPEFKKLFGLQEGAPAMQIYNSVADRDAVIDELHRNGLVRHREMRLKAANGQLRYFLVTFAPFVHGGEEGVMGWLLDITDRRDAEEEIQRGRLFMEAVLENINSAIYVKDAQGIYTYVNSEWEKATGLLRANVLGHSTLQVHHLARGQLYHDVDMRAITEARVVTLEETAGEGDAQRYFQVTKVPMRQGEQVTGLCSIAFDVTERRRIETAIREASEEQDAIFESATLGIAFIKNRNVVRGNTGLGQLFGRSVDSMLGQTTRIWYDSDAAYEAGGASVYQELAAGGTHQREQEFVRADGSHFWCFMSGKAVDAADLSRGTVWMLEDITERRESQAQLEERMADLERFNRLTIDREERMIALKGEINGLLEQAGLQQKYKIVE